MDPKDNKTWKKINLMKEPFEVLIKKYSLGSNTVDFIGHAVALYSNDRFK